MHALPKSGKIWHIFGVKIYLMESMNVLKESRSPSLYADVAPHSVHSDFIPIDLGWLGFADVTASLNPVIGCYLWLLSDIDRVFPPHVQSNKAPISRLTVLCYWMIFLLASFKTERREILLGVFVHFVKGQAHCMFIYSEIKIIKKTPHSLDHYVILFHTQ